MSCDPGLPFTFTALSYHQQSVICYVRPINSKGTKFVAGFPTPTGDVIEIELSFIDGMLLGDGSELIEAFESANSCVYFTRSSSMSKLQRLKLTTSGKPKKTKWSSTHPDAPSELIRGQFRVISGYTDAQIEKLNLAWKLIRNSWSLSKADI